MTILSEGSLKFARDHIERFYDTDFFPKPFEFEAIWENWGEVVKQLTSSNVQKIPSYPPVALPWKKAKGGYRIVHQLDPIDSLIYTALVFQVANDIESARIPIDEKIACAYRIELGGGSYFVSGTGYENFRKRTLDLCANFKHVLVTDITDFYNQIYLHRLNNAIEHSNPKLKGIADDIEAFLGKLNAKSSQGVPVGPAASIVMAEATLMDVDSFLVDASVMHTRYVDDFRIFANDRATLDNILQELTLYLYQNHRLSISGEKTRIWESENFVKQELNNPYELEKIEIFEEIEVFNEYTQEVEDILHIEDKESTHAEKLKTVFDSLSNLIERRAFDLGFCRALIRQAKALKSREVSFLFFEHFEFFEPVLNNFMLYLHDVTDEEFAEKLTPQIEALLKTHRFNSALPRLWFEWYLTAFAAFMKSKNIKQFIDASPHYISKARAAVITQNLSWVRKEKGNIFNVGPWDKRAILFASRILPGDERKHWLQSVIDGSALPLDRWVATWALGDLRSKKKAKNDVFNFDDEIPF